MIAPVPSEKPKEKPPVLPEGDPAAARAAARRAAVEAQLKLVAPEGTVPRKQESGASASQPESAAPPPAPLDEPKA